jgi:ribosomal protein S18 acetylase RimI-like enzyme
MFTIDAFRQSDFSAVISFVQQIQEHERIHVADLRAGTEIGLDYATLLLRTVAEQNGCIVMARTGTDTIGFACAWLEEDDDPLLREDARSHAYVSDIFVDAVWRRQGVGLRLLQAVEAEMRSRGCRRIRICSKATNRAAIRCYDKAGYRPYEVILAKPLDMTP